MHELGVTFYVVRDVKKVAEENQIKHVSAVTIELGEVSTVIPEYLIDCWNWAAGKEEVLKGAQMKIETIPAVSHCNDCNTDYETVKYAKVCPKCGSENTCLLKGNEFTIKEIEVDEE